MMKQVVVSALIVLAMGFYAISVRLDRQEQDNRRPIEVTVGTSGACLYMEGSGTEGDPFVNWEGRIETVMDSYTGAYQYHVQFSSGIYTTDKTLNWFPYRDVSVRIEGDGTILFRPSPEYDRRSEMFTEPAVCSPPRLEF